MDAMRSFREFKKLCEAVEEQETQSAGKIAALARAAAEASMRQQMQQEYDDAVEAGRAATEDLAAAEAQLDAADIVRDTKGKPVPKTRRFYLQNNPKAARSHEENKANAQNAVDAAQAAIDDSTQRVADLEAQMNSEDPLLTKSQQIFDKAMADSEANGPEAAPGATY